MGKDQELLEAARKGNTAVVEKILSQKAKRSGPLASLRRGPGANVQDSSGYTPLHHASLNGHAEIVRLLIAHDANPNSIDVKGSSPLHLAAWSGHLEIVTFLLSGPAICNVNLTTKDDETALHCAAQYGHTDVVRLLLEHNSDPGIRNCKGETALDLAAQYGRLETVELLVRTDPMLIQYLKRTLPDTVFPHTPLHLASRNGHRAVVDILLKAGFSVNMKTKAGTALHEAALCGKVDVVRTLLGHGANPNIRDFHGFTVMDLLKQFNTAPASQEIFNILKRHKRGLPLVESDVESVNNPFPPVPNTGSDLGSPYENVRPSSKSARSTATDPSPGTSPQRWDCQAHPPPEGFEDRRVSGLSMHSNPYEGAYVDMTRSSALTRINTIPKSISKRKKQPISFDDLHFTFKEALKSSLEGFYNVNHSLENFLICGSIRQNLESHHHKDTHNNSRESNHYNENGAIYTTCVKNREQAFLEGDCGIFSLKNSPSDASILKDGVLQNFDSNMSRESENSLYQIPGVPRQFIDGSYNNHPEDLNYLCTSRESDQISLSSTASSYSGYPRRPDSGGYTPITTRGGHSPGSGSSKVSPTPPKKPPRRAVPISPTHFQPMSSSVDGYSNNAYEYLFLSHTGTRSQDNLDKDRDSRDAVKRLQPCRSVDQYVEMNVFNIAVDDEIPERPRSELQRGKSEDLDCRKKLEPVAITSYHENQIVRQQNPRRKLRRNQDVYEDFHTFRRKKEDQASSSAPEATFRSSAYLMITNNPGNTVDSDSSNAKFRHSQINKRNSSASAISSNSVTSSNGTKDRDSNPLSPTHYKQPSTPDHPPPTPMQAESIIYEKIRPLSQEYKRRSRDIETETEEEYLLIGDFESSGSFSSSISLSDRSVDNILEDFHSDTPYSGLIRGSSTHILENLNMNIPAIRPKTLKKLKRVYDNSTSNGDGSKSDNEISSSSEKETENKENRERDRVSALSPFDEQEEWGKIQEIMASFGTGIVRESIFVAELEKEFQNRLMTISCSQNTLDNNTVTNNICDVEKWLQSLNMGEYAAIFMSNGFDNINFFNGVLDEADLTDLGISSTSERETILNAIKQLPLKIHDKIPITCNNNNEINLVKQWLRNINLEQYYETFDKHLYHDMERVKRIWDVELSAVLDIDRIGHRKRILASVSQGENMTSGPKLEEINADVNLLKANNQSFKDMPSPSSQSNYSVNSNTGTIRHRHKKSRPAPQPPVKKPDKKYSEIHVGGSNSIKSRWRHQPILLITSFVKYSTKYWGSTTIKEFKGTESSKKSIERVLKSKECPLEDIVLSISYKGVKFVNPINKTTICEHEIININHACQDDEQQSYFAYITQDNDIHYCHVFQGSSAECATEIILTLGQAFELAYQMALRDQVTSKKPPNRGHRPELQKPAVSPGSVSSHSRDFKDSTRIADVRLNGHPLKMIPLTLSIAAEPETSGGHQKTPTKMVSAPPEFRT